MEKLKFHVNGTEFNVRALKGKEIKTLRKEELELIGTSPERMGLAVERVLSIVLSKAEVELLDEMDYPATLKVFEKINELTYGSAEETKNL
jgi:hypothetical protein